MQRYDKESTVGQKTETVGRAIHPLIKQYLKSKTQTHNMEIY